MKFYIARGESHPPQWATCDRCGGPNSPVWAVGNEDWERIAPDPDAVLCLSCFKELSCSRSLNHPTMRTPSTSG